MSIIDLLAMCYLMGDLVDEIVTSTWYEERRVDLLRAFDAGCFHNIDWLVIA